MSPDEVDDVNREDSKPAQTGGDALDTEGSLLARREFLMVGMLGLATAGVGQLILRAEARPTEPSGSLGAYTNYVAKPTKTIPPLAGNQPIDAAQPHWALTEDNILGPFYRAQAPFRAKITPPLEPGKVVLVSGRVWAFDTRKPLSHATIDIWQASSQGRYDNDDANKPPKPNVFLNRARLVTDETGYYEYETIHPGQYQIGQNQWRPSHIHYLVQSPGYKTLVTQLYFEGDRYNAADAFIKKSLIVKFQDAQKANQSYEVGRFDIVLAKKA